MKTLNVTFVCEVTEIQVSVHGDWHQNGRFRATVKIHDPSEPNRAQADLDQFVFEVHDDDRGSGDSVFEAAVSELCAGSAPEAERKVRELSQRSTGLYRYELQVSAGRFEVVVREQTSGIVSSIFGHIDAETLPALEAGRRQDTVAFNTSGRWQYNPR